VPGRVDPAVAHARRVVGLYGDPDVSWSIVMALTLRTPRTVDAVAAAAASLVARHPHLGSAPRVDTFDPVDEGGLITRFADTPYGDRDPLLRVGMAADGTVLVVAGFHGAVDGLGLLGAAGALAGLDLTSSVRGIVPAEEPTRFLARSLGRLAELALSPPLRLATTRTTGTGDVLTSRVVELAGPGTAALVAAAALAVRRWNSSAPTDAPGRRLVVAAGLSRRPGTPTPTPDRDTAYVRLAAADVSTTAQARDLLARTAPEPAFPVTDASGLAPRVIRLLSSRLGATVLVSNLGRIDHQGLAALRFWPVPTSPAGAAIGLATTAGTTTLAVRVRRGWFSVQAAEAWTDLVAAALVEVSAQ
jgi:hypothetical protein